MKLSVKDVTIGLVFHGEVQGKRQHYYVLSSAKLVFTRSRSRRQVPSPLAALNMPYVLVATGRAGIDRRHKTREIFFNVKA